MKKTLISIVATVMQLTVCATADAQSPGLSPSFPGTSHHIYQPTLMASAPFQAGDLEVPIPADPGGAAPLPAGSGTPQGATPSINGPVISSPDMSLPVYQDNTTWNAFSPPVVTDPFLQPQYGAPMSPYGAPMSPYGGYPQSMPQQGIMTYGANGAQPYRFGWQNRVDVSWMPGQSANGGGWNGDHGIFGVDYELAYGTPFIPGWVLNWTNQFSYRNWDVPTGGGVSLPSDLFRFGFDFEMETPQAGPFSLSLGVTPSINTDLDADVWDEGFQIDGRGIVFMQLDQYWTLGLGAQYWDRVDDRVIPWAGLIYRDDYWEWQLMYPEARISVFLGNEAYWAKWAYVRAEYHVESYGFDSAGTEQEVEIEDYRVLGGFKMDGGYYNWFIEAGWVFERDVKFSGGTPGYSIGDGFIGQIGLRF